MIYDLSVLFELRRPATSKTRPPVSTLALDGLYALLSLVLAVGIFIDVWSHNSFGPDQSVLSPYHFLFYASVATIGGLLLWVHTTNLRRGYSWSSAMPVGYGLSFLGVILFGVSGVIDLTGHTLFGFETGIEAIMSPTHVMLFIGWFIIALAPIRAGFAREQTTPARDIRQQLPLLMALVSALCAVTLTTIYYTPLSVMPNAVQELRTLNEDFSQLGEISGIFIQTGVLMTFLVWVMSSITLRMGFVFLLLTGLGVLLAITTLDPIAIVNASLTGIGLEILYTLIRPRRTHPTRFLLFSFLAPITLWGIYYGFYLVSGIGGGIWVTGYVWLGTVFQSGFVGLALAYFATRQVEVAR